MSALHPAVRSNCLVAAELNGNSLIDLACGSLMGIIPRQVRWLAQQSSGSFALSSLAFDTHPNNVSIRADKLLKKNDASVTAGRPI